MKTFAILVLTCLLAGCAAAPEAPPLADAAYPPAPAAPVEASEFTGLFGLSALEADAATLRAKLNRNAIESTIKGAQTRAEIYKAATDVQPALAMTTGGLIAVFSGSSAVALTGGTILAITGGIAHFSKKRQGEGGDQRQLNACLKQLTEGERAINDHHSKWRGRFQIYGSQPVPADVVDEYNASRSSAESTLDKLHLACQTAGISDQ